MTLDLILIGLGITLYPLPIMAFVMAVSAPRGVWNGLAFVLAWLACLVAVITIVLALTGGQPPPPKSPPSTAALAAKLAFGIALVVYGLHRRRLRGTARDSSGPSAPDSPTTRTSRMYRSSIWSSAVVAVLLQPWGMVGAAAATVVQADLSRTESFLALLGFCILATFSLLAMEVSLVFAPQPAHLALTKLSTWLQRHQEQALVVLCLLLGMWVAGRSLYQLTS
ncbi:GAP family protein [Streptomyces sp. NPDC006551]|uniref:GAP family protein n=1 Tax=Streptomyces sp. NPDC006551 TaxID=3157178 RepID=UPI0033AAAA47